MIIAFNQTYTTSKRGIKAFKHRYHSCHARYSKKDACSYLYAWLTSLTLLHHSTYASMHAHVIIQACETLIHNLANKPKENVISLT